MMDGRLLKDVMHGELATGHRPEGHPALRFKDVCKRDRKLKALIKTAGNLQTAATAGATLSEKGSRGARKGG